jgi:predicted ATP-dependent endonuclease of OLD family
MPKQALPDLLLSSVRLERFKAAFQPAKVELHPFTILIGKNGSGKSTLLEALQWIDTSVRFDAPALERVENDEAVPSFNGTHVADPELVAAAAASDAVEVVEVPVSSMSL